MSKKIEKLTPEQEAKFPEYVNKWVSIGTNTDRLDFDTTLEIVNDFRELIGKSRVPLMIVDNPIEAWVCCCLLKQDVKHDDLREEMTQVFNGNPKKYLIPTAVTPYQNGSFFAHIFSFYDYMLTELDLDIDPELENKYRKWERTAQIGCIYPMEDITIVCEKPTEIHLNENNQLHRDGGPALVYAGLGDFKIYSLNNVTVPEYLAVTPAEELDITLYNKEQNADVKAEFVRKVGIERFLESGKKVDSYEQYDGPEYQWWHNSQYELWDMASMFSNLTYAPFLKMQNQTTKIWHMEGVSPGCRTIQDAVKERFGGRDFVIRDIA